MEDDDASCATSDIRLLGLPMLAHFPGGPFGALVGPVGVVLRICSWRISSTLKGRTFGGVEICFVDEAFFLVGEDIYHSGQLSEMFVAAVPCALGQSRLEVVCSGSQLCYRYMYHTVPGGFRLRCVPL